MKVRELIAVLNRIPQDQPVLVSSFKTDYEGTYMDAIEPTFRGIFQKEGCTILGKESESIFDCYTRDEVLCNLKQISSNSKGATYAS